MSTEGFSTDWILAGLLVFSRLLGVFVSLLAPGVRQIGATAVVVLSAAVGLLLLPLWPQSDRFAGASLFALLGWILSEATLGAALGLATQILTESFLLASQLISLQAGFTYASTVNPTTDADANSLQVVFQLYAMQWLLSLGLDRWMVRALAESLERLPVGQWPFRRLEISACIAWSSEMWVSALRFALPLVILLVVLDVTLALFGRICAQLQLLSVAFPAKILAAVAALAMFLPSLGELAGQLIPESLDRLLALGGGAHP
ncbi:MAG: flagellar biosynthetic protein FliR [Bryobacteraceae bacterium]|nr:flagellar biosynthetic protein FliR [Bryobacteraceae bacterium]MDW8380048.1 flagellar biosynthetic protein FliR [Bryobacterales bacterium]